MNQKFYGSQLGKSLLIGILCLFMGTGCPLFKQPSGLSAPNASFTVFQQKMLEEVNFARLNPAGYAEERLKGAYETKTDNGAYQDLKKRSAVGELTLQQQLCTAATKYALYLAQNNAWGHREQGTPQSRAEAAGYSDWSGENIAGNTRDTFNAEQEPESAAIQFVQQLIIDEGVPGVGHRVNIMNPVHRKLGAGFGRDLSSNLINYTVQEFGSQ